MKDKKRIAIVEKDKILKSIFELFAEQADYEVVASFISFEESINFLQKESIDILVFDLNIIVNFLDVKTYVDRLKDLNSPIIFIGNSPDITIAQELIQSNLYSFVTKPLSKDILKINIEIAFEKHLKIQEKKEKEILAHCDAYCEIDKTGLILNASKSFDYEFSTNTEKKINISEVFPYNKEFEDIDFFLESTLKNKRWFFKFNQNIVITEVIKNNNLFKICFSKANKEDTSNYLLEISKSRLKSWFKNTEESIILFNTKHKVSEFNKKAEDWYNSFNNGTLKKGLYLTDIINFIPKHELENLQKNLQLNLSHSLHRNIKINNKTFVFDIGIFPIINKKILSKKDYFITIRDHTHITNLEKELSSLKEEIKSIYESTIQRFYLTDANKKLIAFNDSAFKIIQKEFNHSLKKGDNIINFIPKEVGIEQFNNYFEQAFEGKHISFKTHVISSNPDYWVEIHLEPIINDNGELNKVLIWTLDITKSEKNLIALKESRQRYELIAKGGNDGLWDWNIETNDVFLSERWKNLLGYDDDEFDNEFGVRNSLIHPDDSEKNERIIKTSLEGNNNIYQNEIRLKCKDGSYKWVLERGYIQRDENNKAFRMAGTITDITDRKKTEQTILALNNSLLEERAMFVIGNVGIIRVKSNNLTDVTYVSENSTEILGYTPQEFYQHKVPFKDLIHKDDQELHRKERNEAIAKNQKFIDFSDYRLHKKNGEIIWIRDFTTIIRDKEGKVVDLLGYFIDITEAKETEKELLKTQNLLGAIWHTLNTKTFVLSREGEILYSKTSKSSQIKKLNKKEFIQNIFPIIDNWSLILKEIYENADEVKLKDKETLLHFISIDEENILLTTNISLKNY